ncbi:hypothetical protein LWI29_017155 [Acer saccharum]|uniref:Uncharacterized protein n=1 Tax=Acer saccharum TaxID=4024 RepID=A0AA39RZ34_ACESA|nr:hypothetical protein LWI29_017155 [Acer saccharum]
MAGNMELADDAENGYRNRVQPYGSTPKPHERLIGEEKQEREPTSLKKILGLEEILNVNIWRASLAELLGTATLVFALDTIVISSIETETKTPNLVMSTLVAIIVTILLLATFPISGGHINPIISFSAALTGICSFTRAAIYITAQCLGGILGALALKAVVKSSVEDTFSLGGCTLHIVTAGPQGPIVIGLETGQALWLEIICSFVFLFASIWMAFDQRQVKALGRVAVCIIIGIVLGILVFVSTTVTATKGYAGAGLNPARCLGPALIRGGHLWDGHWVFWVGPAIACVAFAMYKEGGLIGEEKQKQVPTTLKKILGLEEVLNVNAPAAIYILAQCLGGILGALALKAVVKSSIEDTFSLGGCTLTIVMAGPQGPMEIGLETGQSLWLEIICSFVFLFASIWMAFD